jgi:O-antigen ligase
MLLLLRVRRTTQERTRHMLWTIAVALLSLWVVGSVLPLVGALAVVLVRVLRPSRAAQRLVS